MTSFTTQPDAETSLPTETGNDSRVSRFGVDGTGVAVDEYVRAVSFDAGTVPPVRPRTTRIVVGLDGSPASIDALKRAVRIATGLNATVQPVVAWHNPLSYGNVAFTDWSPEGDAKLIVDDAITELFADLPPDWLTPTVIEGLPAEVLIRESRGAEMLVVGSRGHGGFVGLLLGSVSAACAEHAHCPVLIIHDSR